MAKYFPDLHDRKEPVLFPDPEVALFGFHVLHPVLLDFLRNAQGNLTLQVVLIIFQFPEPPCDLRNAEPAGLFPFSSIPDKNA